MARFIPKGKTATSKGVRPDFLTKKQAEAFQKERRNYNQRVYRAETKEAKRLGVTREDIRKTGYTGIPMFKTLGEIKNKREYQALMQMMKHQKTKTFKTQHEKEFRDTMFDVIDYAYYPSPEGRKWLRDTIRHMSSAQILEFRMNNPALVKDYFHKYEENMAGNADEEAMELGWKKLVTALSPYARKPYPGQ